MTWKTLQNLTGERFGELTVLDVYEIRKSKSGKSTCTYWLCLCSCGVKKFISRGNLIQKNIKSCSCKWAEGRRLESGRAAKNKVFRDYKNGAKSRELEFSLSFSEFILLMKDNCYYCGIKPSKIQKSRSNNGVFIRNGIDRVNNNIGYCSNNVVTACQFCNRAKSNKSLDEFKTWILNVANRFRKNYE